MPKILIYQIMETKSNNLLKCWRYTRKHLGGSVLPQSPLNDFIEFYGNSRHNTRLSASHLMIRPKSYKTVKGTEFLFNRIVKPWNNLPPDLKCIKCKNKDIWPFKGRLLKYYHQRTEQTFQSENLCTWTSSCRCPACRPV